MLISTGLEISRVTRSLRIATPFPDELESCLVTEGLELELEFCLTAGFNAVAGEEGFRATLGAEGFSAADGAEGFSAADDEVGLSAAADEVGLSAADGADGLRAAAGTEGFNADFGSLPIGCVPGLTMGLGVEVNEGGLTGSVGLLSSLFDSFLENLEKSDLDSLVSDGTGLSFTS